MGRHVAHLAVEAGGQPGGKTGFGCRQIDAGHADLGESERVGPVPDARHQPESIVLNHNSRHPSIVESGPETAASPSDPLHLHWPDEAATAAFAAQLARLPEAPLAFITLRGELGAGKTTLVRHLLRAMGVQGRIKSPTYAVVEPHQSALGAAWHFDFYRFDDPREWEDAGFRDIFASDGLKLAEWPDKAAAMLPAPDLDIALAVRTDEGRDVRISAHTERGARLLAELRA